MNLSVKQKTRRFMIFREGSAVNWDCHYKDLEKATGIPSSTIKSICNSTAWKQRGWHPRIGSDLSEAQVRSATQQRGVDQIMQLQKVSKDRSMYDD